MGKQSCCFCSKELGRISNKFPKSDYRLRKFQDDVQVMKMSDNDVICYDCYQMVKHPEKFQKTKELTGRYDDLKERSKEYKKHWDKRGVIQFKNERFAILQRAWGDQVEFIVAFDDPEYLKTENTTREETMERLKKLKEVVEKHGIKIEK